MECICLHVLFQRTGIKELPWWTLIQTIMFVFFWFFYGSWFINYSENSVYNINISMYRVCKWVLRSPLKNVERYIGFSLKRWQARRSIYTNVNKCHCSRCQGTSNSSFQHIISSYGTESAFSHEKLKTIYCERNKVQKKDPRLDNVLATAVPST